MSSCSQVSRYHLLLTRYRLFLVLPLMLLFVNERASVITASILFYFFRNPDRLSSTSDNNDYILSAADGMIMDINHEGQYIRVCIFLSVFDVHVQYSPVNGYVSKQEYKKGEFHPAFLLEKSQYNERMTTTITTTDGDIVKVVQIAGQIANRIDSFVCSGIKVQKGCRLGMILFGSRVDVLVPTNKYIPLVEKGQYVYGGLTPLYSKRTI